jgi:hypothetical protein
MSVGPLGVQPSRITSSYLRQVSESQQIWWTGNTFVREGEREVGGSCKSHLSLPSQPCCFFCPAAALGLIRWLGRDCEVAASFCSQPPIVPRFPASLIHHKILLSLSLRFHPESSALGYPIWPPPAPKSLPTPVTMITSSNPPIASTPPT